MGTWIEIRTTAPLFTRPSLGIQKAFRSIRPSLVSTSYNYGLRFVVVQPPTFAGPLAHSQIKTCVVFRKTNQATTLFLELCTPQHLIDVYKLFAPGCIIHLANETLPGSIVIYAPVAPFVFLESPMDLEDHTRTVKVNTQSFDVTGLGEVLQRYTTYDVLRAPVGL